MNNSAALKLEAPSKISLLIAGLKPPPSFKNSKMLTRGRLITDPKKQQWMKACQDAMEWQLVLSYIRDERETATVARLRSWIASSTPADDSSRFLTRCSWQFYDAPKECSAPQIQVEIYRMP